MITGLLVRNKLWTKVVQFKSLDLFNHMFWYQTENMERSTLSSSQKINTQDDSSNS